METLLSTPITTQVATLVDVLKNARYRIGNPRQYRANAKDGKFTLEGSEPVGSTVRLHVLAYRIFEGELFKRENVWLELFFLDSKGNVSSMLFNSYSVGNFQRFQDTLYYRGVPLEQVVIQIRWTARTATLPNDEQITYHIADFETVEELSPEISDIITEFIQMTPIYREDTAPALEDRTKAYQAIEQHNYMAIPPKALPAPTDEDPIGAIEHPSDQAEVEAALDAFAAEDKDSQADVLAY
ncbi:MAG: hypothetical protein WBA23_03130 [Tunicatimonas sp.]|uniref:hypothetical protein n=1 Tax=Tunicatimonas sp. TaxID=1940096 RepID=UPI003C71F31C